MIFKKQQDPDNRILFRMRYANEWTGAIVLLCVLAFVGAIIEAGILRDWVTPAAKLNIILPQSGVANLSVGDNVEVFGINAGTIKEINVNSDGGLSALATVRPQLRNFIRKDSQVTIKRQFAVAGASYVAITRGYSAPLNWNYAVVIAKTEPNPADQLSQMVAEIRKRIVPTMDSAQNIMSSLEIAIEGIQQGKGTIGRLINNDELIRRSEKMIQSLNDIINQLKPIEHNINHVIRHSDKIVSNFEKVSKDITNVSPQLNPISKNIAETTEQLPSMMIQLQSTVHDLQQLINQLKSLWILGGSSHPSSKTKRLPAREINP
ncbi:hypothetical protein COMNV_01145 [Commensalibacter sp. Nvir]|uniref:MlaD family protein n=1 Tax=Commensalibacter sp. Nvir TaxID=3069817 RepID=UPI002D44BA98|nr:hypothetical protein COMNV_01145 [Commensalibacter sp. Nvir]